MIGGPGYRAHDLHIGPARRAPALWRLMLGAALILVGYIALLKLFVETLARLFANDDPYFIDYILLAQTPTDMIVLLTSFICLLMPVVVVVRLLHRRTARSLLGPIPLALRQFAVVAVALAILGLAIAILPPWDMGGPLKPNLEPGTWLLLLPVSALAVLIQVSAEEVAFRGYLQQQLAARFRSPLIWGVLPSILFAYGHYSPDDAGSNALTIAIWAGMFGVLMADITARAGSLGPAIALHFYTNIMALVVVSLSDDLSGLALYHAPFGLGDEAALRAWLPVDFAHMVVAWLVARLAIRR